MGPAEQAMSNERQPGMPNGVEATAALIVFSCIIGGMWILLFKAAQVLLGALGRLYGLRSAWGNPGPFRGV